MVGSIGRQGRKKIVACAPELAGGGDDSEGGKDRDRVAQIGHGVAEGSATVVAGK